MTYETRESFYHAVYHVMLLKISLPVRVVSLASYCQHLFKKKLEPCFLCVFARATEKQFTSCTCLRHQFKLLLDRVIHLFHFIALLILPRFLLSKSPCDLSRGPVMSGRLLIPKG